MVNIINFFTSVLGPVMAYHLVVYESTSSLLGFNGLALLLANLTIARVGWILGGYLIKE
jgi:hypothetical protein